MAGFNSGNRQLIRDANGNMVANPSYDPNYVDNRYAPQNVAQTQNTQSQSAQMLNANSPNFSNVTPPDLTNFRPFSEATYAEATRLLDPNWEAQRRRFDQDMVNRGISENTDAYRTSFDNFSRSRNDAYNSAANQALMAALGAQNQAFGQDFQNRSLQQQGDIAAQQIAAQEAARAAQEASSQRQYQSMLEQLNENRRQFDLNFGEQRRIGDRGFGEDVRRWDLTRGDGLENADFGRLMELAGYGMNQTGFNNAASQQELQNTMPWLGLIPNQGPTGIDVLSPYQMNQQALQAAYQQQAQRNNGFWGALGQVGGAALPFIFSSKDLKTGGELHDTNAALNAVLSMPVRVWSYKPEFDANNEAHIGPWAEDFNKALGLKSKPVIHIADAIGALIGAVQAQAAQIEELKSQIKKAA